MQIIWAIVGFIFAIGLLTTIHEFGHFWVARMLGVKVLRFSVGFGKPLLSWHDKQGTEYVIASLPLGGYVKMLDETETKVSKNERHKAFNNKSVWARIAIVIAGPLFNILFAIAAYWFVFVSGVPNVAPVLGSMPKDSIAYKAGLDKGYEIVAIENKPVSNWEQVSVLTMPYLGERGYLNLKAKSIDSKEVKSFTLDLSTWVVSNKEGDLLKSLGFEPYDPLPPVIDSIMPGHPAANSDLKANDRILKVDGVSFNSRSELINYVRKKANKTLIMEVKRGDEIISLNIKPATKVLAGGEEVGFIGVAFSRANLPDDYIRITKYGVFEAVVPAIAKTFTYIKLTFQFLYKMLVGKASLQHVSGPISIAKYAGVTASYGLNQFLGFLALISISLGVLNILPIPLLDGGYLLFYTFEIILGRPVSEKTASFGRAIGFVMLSTLMFVALINDILRL